MWFQNKKSIIEKELFEIYVNNKKNTIGISENKAKEMVRDMLKQAKQKVSQAKEDRLPENFGTLMLQNEKNDPKHINLHIKRSNGVRDDDVLWLWNMHPLERRMIEIDDEATKMVAFMSYTEKGLTSEEATKKMRKYFIYYGDPTDTKKYLGDDKPLPPELKNRINEWLESNSNDQKTFKSKLEEFSTMNAFIRAEIRARKI